MTTVGMEREQETFFMPPFLSQGNAAESFNQNGPVNQADTAQRSRNRNLPKGFTIRALSPSPHPGKSKRVKSDGERD
jgi:hypothetical protein